MKLFSKVTNQSGSNNFLTIDFSKFMEAVRRGDSQAIDAMLEAKAQGCQLDLNETEGSGSHSKSALEILLSEGDFTNARKLLNAGADRGVSYQEWVPDPDSCYPYGDMVPRRRDFFQSFQGNKAVIDFLEDYIAESRRSARPGG